MSAINDSSSNAKQELLKHLLKKKGIRLTSETIEGRTQSTQAPLSFAEQRLWFLYQLEGENSTYNIPFALLLNGNLNKAALEGAIAEILRRHEVLRTRFQVVNDTPVRVIDPEITVSLKVVDLQDLPEAEQLTTVKRLVTIEAEKPFDLAKEPLVRVHLWRVSSQSHVLLINMHHIVSDGWSMGIFTQELSALYKAFLSGEPSPLPELPIQYTDFAVWQRQWLTGEVLEKQLDYWKQQLAGAPEVLALPIDRPRQAVQAFRGATVSFLLPLSLSEALKALSKRTGVSLFMTLYAAFVTLLYRYTGSDDIVVGTPIANRNRPEIEGLIGFFINRLVLRTSLSGNPSFEDLLSRVRDVALGAYAHQDVPFEKLVEELQPARDLSYAPLVQVIFALNEPMPQIQMAGLTVSPLAVETATAKFDLILSLENTATGLIGQWEYNSDLFDAPTIARMTGHFQTLLEGIVSNPTRRLSDLPLLRELEQQQLLVEWNNTFAAFPTVCVHQRFEAVVELTPDAIAVVFEDKQLTYRELNQRANQLAHYLRTLGVERKVIVGICVERSLEMVVSLLGILKAGGAYLPLDPALPQESLTFRLIDAQVPILLTQKGLLKREDAQVQTVLYLDADWELIAQESDANPNSEVTPDNLAYVLYTSGSTGQPKGVAIEHRQILNYLHAILDKLQLPTGASFATVSTFAADLGNTAIFPALCTGGYLHIVSQERVTDPKALGDYFQRHPIDCLKITPAHLATLLASNASDSILPRQCLVLGGEAASWDLIEKIQQYAPNCRILNHYGPTETTVGVLTYPVSSKQVNYNSKTVPIGRPIANTQVYILDRHQQPVPIGVPGELHIGGASLARGYLNRPDLTDEKFINPFNDKINTRLYKTGDLARYLRDGNIEFLGRIDNQVKIRGFRIELGEIEAVLSQHLEVRETVVLAWENQPDNKQLVAYVVPNHKPPATSELRHFLQQKLPDYMVPGAFVMLSSLPLTPNGKVDRRALKAPDTSLRDSIGFVPPRDTFEQQLQLLWSEVLKLPTVGVKDNFFTLGGHSLLAVLLMAQISRHFGKNLPIATLFSSPTIEQLASCLRSETHSLPWSPLVAIQSGGDKRPFFFVPGVGGQVMYLYELARHLGSSQPFYGLQARGLDGESEPFIQLEEIASYYIEAIQSVQPTGPYLLGGHSFGGVVAFEMAMMLHKQGQHVALLAMIDTFAPIVGKKSKGIDEDDAAYLTDFANYIGYLCSKNLEVSQETLASLTPVEQLHYLKERLIRVNLLPKDAGITSVRGLVQVYKESMKAYRAYLPSGVQQTSITLFRASEVDVFESDTEEMTQRLKEPALGWNDFSSTINVHVVPGNHMTMMQQPHVQVLATQLLSCLEQAQAPLA